MATNEVPEVILGLEVQIPFGIWHTGYKVTIDDAKFRMPPKWIRGFKIDLGSSVLTNFQR